MKPLINVIIVDDEPACIQKLSKDLEAFPQIRILDTITSSEKARKSIVKNQPDLLFMDVEMPKTNGIELLQDIRSEIHSNMRVVFYTAFNQYMIEALRASAFDFLLKPYLLTELKAIIQRFEEQSFSATVNFEQSMRRLLFDDNKFAIQTITGLLLIRRKDVLYFQFLSDMHCWQMILTDRSRYKLRTSTTAKELLQISSLFLQTGQDCILNIDYLMSIENKTLRCILLPPYQDLNIIVSRRYFSKIKDALEML